MLYRLSLKNWKYVLVFSHACVYMSLAMKKLKVIIESNWAGLGVREREWHGHSVVLSPDKFVEKRR